MGAGQVHQVHVVGAVRTDDQLVSCHRHVNHVVDRQDDVAAADAVVLLDGHGRLIARLGIVLIWHGQAERQFVSDRQLQVDLVHWNAEALLDNEIPTIMADHEPATSGIDVFIGKLVVV